MHFMAAGKKVPETPHWQKEPGPMGCRVSGGCLGLLLPAQVTSQARAFQLGWAVLPCASETLSCPVLTLPGVWGGRLGSAC